MGNFGVSNVQGLTVSAAPEAEWFVVFSYVEDGHVPDNEAINGDEILAAIREGAQEENRVREQRGFGPLTVEGRMEPTRVLGRRGVASVNLVTAPERLQADKPHVFTVLQATRFEQGSRYEDFVPGTDRVAEYGIAALVAGASGRRPSRPPRSV